MTFGIVVWLLGQMMINVGMVLALLPVIGIPLPLVSYGGSALRAVAGRPRPARSASRAASPRPPRALAAAHDAPASAGVSAGRARQAVTSRPMRVLLAGGGSAGHTSPLLATADALRRLDPASRSPASAPASGLETRVVPEAGYPLELVPQRPAARGARTPTCSGVPGPAARPRVAAALEVLDRIRPDVVVGFGGYVSVPAYLAARTPQAAARRPRGERRCPASPTSSAPGSPTTSPPASPTPPLPHATYVGLPIRRMIATLDRAALRAEARASSASTPTGRRCWSPAARRAPRRLNQAVLGAAPALADAGVQVLHVVGPQHEATPPEHRRALRRASASSTGWTSPTPPPTLVLCRAGANTVTEVSGVGLPAIFVPLPIGNGEQALNARAGRRRRGRRCWSTTPTLTPDWVADHASPLLTDADAARARWARRPPA